MLILQMQTVLGDLSELQEFNSIIQIKDLSPGSVKAVYYVVAQKETATSTSQNELELLVKNHILKSIDDGGPLTARGAFSDSVYVSGKT